MATDSGVGVVLGRVAWRPGARSPGAAGIGALGGRGGGRGAVAPLGRGFRRVRGRRPVAGDRGAGTLWVLAFAGVVWTAGTAAVAVGAVRAVRHRADAAADLAALAGAQRVAEGGAAACRRAGRIAAESGARLARCQVRGAVVDVTVAVRLRAPRGIGDFRVVSRARAGPAGPDVVTWRDTAR